MSVVDLAFLVAKEKKRKRKEIRKHGLL